MGEVKFFWQDPVSTEIIRISWRAAFGKSVDDELWEKKWNWRFLNNPLSKQPLAAYVWENGEIASYYAISPLLLVTPEGHQVKSGLMNMGFTHPKYQGLGYYLELNKKMHIELQNQGFEAIFGFSNHNSHYSYRKYLGWNDISLLTNFQLQAHQLKATHFNGVNYHTTIQVMDCDWAMKLGSFVVTNNKYHSERSKEFLIWRFIENPNYNYECIGVYDGHDLLACAVFKVYNDNEVDILEIFYKKVSYIQDEQILLSVFLTILDKKYVKINIWSNLFSNEHLLLEKIGFIEREAVTYFGVIDFKGSENITDITQWHYRFIDSDLY